MVPWGTADGRVRAALPKFVGQWIERMAKQNEDFERVLSVTRCDGVINDPVKGERAEYLVRAEFSSRATKHKIELPDPAITHLLTNYPHKYTERMIS